MLFFLDCDPDWPQQAVAAHSNCDHSDFATSHRPGSTFGYSSDNLRPNITVNQCENDSSWTPFLHQNSPESVI